VAEKWFGNDMGKTCDYYIEKSGRDYCILKNAEISRDFYRDYCRCDDMKKCPIYQFCQNNR